MIRRMQRDASLGVARPWSLGILVIATCFVVGGINNALAFDTALKTACLKANQDRMDASTTSTEERIARAGIKTCTLFISSFAASDRSDLAAAFAERAKLSEKLAQNWGPKRYGDARPLYESVIADYTIAIRLVDRPSLYQSRELAFFSLAVRSDNRADVIRNLEQSRSDMTKGEFGAEFLAKWIPHRDQEIACVRRGGDLLLDCQH